jgi:hypothetical protein
VANAADNHSYSCSGRLIAATEIALIREVVASCQGLKSKRAGQHHQRAGGLDARQWFVKGSRMPGYANLVDKDQAFRWLNTAYQERNVFLLGLKTDFLLDLIRSDPRFAELVRKVGLPQ